MEGSAVGLQDPEKSLVLGAHGGQNSCRVLLYTVTVKSIERH